MKLYAERPVRVSMQLLADALVIGWLVLLVITAQAAYDLVLRLQVPARRLIQAGDAIRGTFDGAAQAASRVPLVGEDLARVLGGGSSAGSSLAQSGNEQIQTIANIAVGTGIAIVVLGGLPVVTIWLLLRTRYARAAGAAAAVRGVDSDLLALRALTNQPVRRLLTVSDDPASAWLRQDRTAIHGLAALELARLGMRAPRRLNPQA